MPPVGLKPPRCAAVIRLDALGDSMLSLPAVEALAAAWPGTRLVVAASPIARDVFRHVAEPVDDLRAARPDVALVFTEKRAGFRLALRSGARVRAGFDPGLTQPLKAAYLKAVLTHRARWPNDLRRDPGLHEVERYFLLLEALGLPVPEEKPPMRLPLTGDDRRFARDFLGDTSPSAFQWMPRWTALGWPESLADLTFQRLPEPRLVLYAPPDREAAEAFTRRHGAKGCCAPELLRYAAVLERCRVLVTPDTGAVHVAAAVGTPVVDLFPERHHEHCVRRWRPWKVEHRVVLRGEYTTGSERDLAQRLISCAVELCPSESVS